MQLGFVIDHARCIGCHACTVACKAENDVPLGSFRTWVKYTEQGSFPDVKRSFAVLRCNQCTDAPCVHICPVRALEKRPDGVVDVDPAACIGCKACMQGCPYDALYLNESTGTAEKCHFCVHRTEVGLAPACAVICPTEAIIPGDFHDPQSVVSKLRSEDRLQARKVEAGTGPNVFYREVGEAGIDPLATSAAGGYLWANRSAGALKDVERFLTIPDAARTTYDVDHPAHWGGKVSAYLFTKSLAAGLVLVQALFLPALAGAKGGLLAWLSLGSLFFLLATTLLLVSDLARPGRFHFILVRPNWSSWLTRGTVVLMAFGAAVAGWTVMLLAGVESRALMIPILALCCLLAALAACYTGWLFGQARGRVLWMRRGLWLHLIVQAVAAGSAFALLFHRLLPPEANSVLRVCLMASLAGHLLFTLTEDRMAPRRREEEYGRAVRLITHGPFAGRRLGLGIVAGILVPSLLLVLPLPEGVTLSAAAMALAGLWSEEEILVRAGQALPIS